MSAIPGQEYLVKLGVKLDETNMAKLINFLQSGKVKAAMLSAALTAAGKVIYNFIRDNTAYEQSLAQTAKTQGKAVETVRAHENALKAMGKTAQEVQKDANLKKIYNDIVKINKEMALPNLKSLLSQVYQLQGEFYTLRSTIQYGLQWINYYLLQDLAEPIKKITEQIKQARTWLQTNIKKVTRSISLYISTFAKGLLGLVDGAKTIFQWFNKLPDGIKSATSAIVAMFAIMKSGPLGQILAMVEMIGGLIHDWENYQYNKNAGVTGEVASQLYNKENGYFGDDGYLTDSGKSFLASKGIDSTGIVDTAFNGIWDVIDNNEKTTAEKMAGVTELITQALVPDAQQFAANLSQWLTDNTDSFSEVLVTLGGILSKVVLDAGKICDSILTAFTSILEDQTLMQNVGKSIGSVFESAMTATSEVGNAIMHGLGAVFSPTKEDDWKAAFGGEENNPWLGGFGAALAGLLFTGGDVKKSMVLGLLTTIGSAFGSSEEIDGITTGADFSGFEEAASYIWGLVVDAFNNVTSIAGDIVSAIGTALTSAFTGGEAPSWDEALGDDNVWLDGLGVAIAAKIAGGSVGVSIFGGIATALVKALGSEDGLTKAWDDLKVVGGELWNGITAGIENLTEWWNGPNGQKFQGELEAIGTEISNTIFGKKDDKTGERTGGLWQSIQQLWEDIKSNPLIQSITETIQSAITSAFDGLVELITPKLEALWAGILANMPDWAKSLLGINDITIATDNGDGTTTYTSSDGGSVTVDTTVGDTNGPTVGDILSAYGVSNVKGGKFGFIPVVGGGAFSPSGLNTWGNDATGDLPNARMMLDGSKSSFTGALTAAAQSGDTRSLQYLLESWNTISGKGEGSEQVRDFATFVKDYKANGVPESWQPSMTITPNAQSPNEGVNIDGNVDLDTSAAESAIDELDRELDNVAGKTRTVDFNARLKQGSGAAGTISYRVFGQGARVDSPQMAEIGEDGTEYVIPITKPDRAFSLIVQMFKEMGSAATNKIMSMMGLDGGAGTLGGSLSGLSGMGGASIIINNNNNVSAPVTLNVYGSGNAEEIGNTAYNTALRYQLRAVEGVLL